ncbi:MAG: carbamoyltransferase HypF, partial [Candidatus Eisenbacteria bacterium]|nr:carbamoyltransferase HypF [Candidatus Eisenbacteria bacterium]
MDRLAWGTDTPDSRRKALMEARRIRITGVVQGVGFRPHVWRQAQRHSVAGWVRNTSYGVDVLVEGAPDSVESFLRALRAEAPRRARIEEVDVAVCDPEGHRDFRILESQPEAGVHLPVSPDIAMCADCAREMRDPADRRFRYPFINCTNCGPRFTIVRDIPYDRPNTTMDSFVLCADCRREYEDPSDRRFHAQPVACPACGPQIWLEEDARWVAAGEEALQKLRRRLRDGMVAAVKGLGGFHLACDAASDAAVERLRQRKHRAAKPFALMAAGTAAVERYAVVTDAERRLLEGPERPVVLLERKDGALISQAVAPGRRELGFMLPYTPLHHLLLEREPGFPDVLVMTSGNLSEEPIAYRDDDARRRLAGIADVFLMHDRPIHMRCDDSVAAVAGDQPYFFRRSRGYAPLPLSLPLNAGHGLAVGGEMKNCFCLGRDRSALLSHYIGTLDEYETYMAFEEGVAHFQKLFRVAPRYIAHDLHPDYQSTRYAQRRAEAEGVPLIAVQHHHAHAAACMAENDLDGSHPVIGVGFDGTGYGTDGAIWGGEFLVADYAGFRRAHHLAYCPLPGGDAAARNPYRIALSWLRRAGVDW